MTLEDQVRLAVGIGWGCPILTPRDIARYEAIVREVVKAFTPIREAALDLAKSLNDGFVVCQRCGDQETTADLDFLPELNAALGLKG